LLFQVIPKLGFNDILVLLLGADPAIRGVSHVGL